MTTDDDNDYEDAWKAIERHPPKSFIREEWLRDQFASISGETSKELVAFIRDFSTKTTGKPDGLPLTSEALSKIVATCVAMFMGKLYQRLKGEELAGLIEIVLEGQNLPPDELKGFVRALPESLLKKIVESVVGTANGVHALMAIELTHRNGNLSEDYTMHQRSDGRIYISVPQKNNEIVNIYLDDKFEG